MLIHPNTAEQPDLLKWNVSHGCLLIRTRYLNARVATTVVGLRTAIVPFPASIVVIQRFGIFYRCSSNLLQQGLEVRLPKLFPTIQTLARVD